MFVTSHYHVLFTFPIQRLAVKFTICPCFSYFYTHSPYSLLYNLMCHCTVLTLKLSALQLRIRVETGELNTLSQLHSS